LALGILAWAAAAACGARSERSEQAPATAGANGHGAASAGHGGSGATSPLAAGASSGGSASAGTSASHGGSGGASSGGASSGGASSGGASSGGASAGAAGASGAPFGGGGNAAGGSPSFPQCQTDADCEIANDCCSCRALVKGTGRATCPVDCDKNACEAGRIPPVAQCTLGRCTLSASCNAAESTCDSLPPKCPPGQTVTIAKAGCWGACVDTTQCPMVTNCQVCADDELCVTFPNIGGTTYRCIRPEASCEAGKLCECLAPCGPYVCLEQASGLSCACPGC
jgi:hypothetical protein